MSGTKDFVSLMLLNCEAVIRKMKGRSRTDWGNDENLRDAVCMRLMALAENVKGYLAQHPELVENHPEIPWNEIARFRDKLAHHYEGIDYDMVWEVVEMDIPPLYQVIQSLK